MFELYKKMRDDFILMRGLMEEREIPNTPRRSQPMFATAGGSGQK